MWTQLLKMVRPLSVPVRAQFEIQKQIPCGIDNKKNKNKAEPTHYRIFGREARGGSSIIVDRIEHRSIRQAVLFKPTQIGCYTLALKGIVGLVGNFPPIGQIDSQ